MQNITSHVVERAENRLGKFILEYRHYLNHQQMWNARAVFDIKLGAIMQVADKKSTTPASAVGVSTSKG